MNHKQSAITSILRRGATFWLGLGLLAFAAQVFAHGGMEHILGTVVKVDNNVLTVKTAKGNLDVKLNEKTEITHDKQPASLADLKPGTRVAVHAMKEGKGLVAHTVIVGAPPAGKRDAREQHK